MKNYFIINPKAGKGKHAEALSERIRYACERCGAEYDIYTTTEVGDATRFVREKCADADNLPARFFACRNRDPSRIIERVGYLDQRPLRQVGGKVGDLAFPQNGTRMRQAPRQWWESPETA